MIDTPIRAYIKFKQQAQAKNDFGSMEDSGAAVTIREIKAEKMTARISEKMTLGETELKRLVFKCRYYENIMDTKLTIEYKGVDYDIIDIDEFCAKRWVLITCQG